MTTHLSYDPSAVTVPLRRRQRRPELWGALACVAAFVAVCLAFLWTTAGQRVDAALMPETSRAHWTDQVSPLYAQAGDVLRFVGNPLHLAAFLVVLLLVSVVLGRWWAGVAGAAVVIGSVLAARMLKELIVRPDLGLLDSSTHNSFPSGHVAAAAGIAFAVLLVAPPRARMWLVLPGVMGTALVTAATIVAGWHRLSDGLGAALVAATLYCLAVALTRRASDRPAALR